MKIALIGATGFVGTAILQEALQRGHEVTAIVLLRRSYNRMRSCALNQGDAYSKAGAQASSGSVEIRW